MKFTLEEIYLIRSCNSKDKNKIINELTKYQKIDDPDIAEMSNSALDKLNNSSDDEFLEIVNHPL